VQPINKKFRTNKEITAREVRLLDEQGEMVGVVNIYKAIEIASNAGLDLIEVSPNANPPVCKVADFGKMRYEMQKKAADSKKKQKHTELKEVKFSVNIGKGDYDFKVKHIIRFLKHKDKVKVSMRIKGREITHLELAEKIMLDIINDIEDLAKIDQRPKMEGRQMVLILSPNLAS
jgi:translation initiation factor IF-3|tara:strand:+ start:5456 stop:5980 length:525 start_codon:yes stop_codon:yes gene_type:complete